MTEREKFDVWWYGGADEINQSRNSAYAGWQAGVTEMSKRVEECERALKVLHTWAGVDAALVPEQVRALISKALHIGAKETK